MKPRTKETDIPTPGTPDTTPVAGAENVPVAAEGDLHTSAEVWAMLKLLTTDMTERKAEKLELQKKVFERTRDLERLNLELQFQNGEKEKRAAELAIANKELLFQNNEKEKRAAELAVANKELQYQNGEKEKRAAELVIANKELIFQNDEKEKRAAELAVANKELQYQNGEKEKRAAELAIANEELIFQNDEKEKRAAELAVANKELQFQNGEKEKRAAELAIANNELIFQNNEKEKRAAELAVANKELQFQNGEKEKRAAELAIANNELIFQNDEKEKRAAELAVANKELLFQNNEKEKRAAELVIANRELLFQNGEKEKRAAELVIANKELLFQNDEKEKRAAELAVANADFIFQSAEKEKRAAELAIANSELAFQNREKENRAAELAVANAELVFQAEEKEKRAAELIAAHEELHVFTYISSHDLQEPLRKIQLFAALLLETEKLTLSDKVSNYLKKITASARQMQILIEALQVYSDVDMKEEQVFEKTPLNEIFRDVYKQFSETILEKKVTIDASRLGNAYVNPYQFKQVFSHLIDNAVKFSRPDAASYLTIRSHIASGRQLEEENPALEEGKLSPLKNYCHIRFSDNGIGFEMEYREKIFEIFQRLHNKGAYAGAGIGLSIIKKIVQNHGGFITATGETDQGAVFDIYIPDEEPLLHAS